MFNQCFLSFCILHYLRYTQLSDIYDKLNLATVRKGCFRIPVLTNCIYALFKYIKSNQIKSLLLSHHHSTSALVSEILMSVLQTVQKNNRQFTYGQTVQKNNKQFTYGQTVQKNNKQFTYGQTVQKNNKQFTYGQTVQKNCTGAFTVLQTVQKKTTTIYIWTDSAKKNNNNLHMDRQCKKQQQFTYGQYIFTDCTEDNVQNTHTYTQYA